MVKSSLTSRLDSSLDSSPGMFTKLEEIQTYIEECEQNCLDLDNEEVWWKAYLSYTRTTEVQGNYEGKVAFKHVQIKLVASNKPLIGFGPLPDWLREKRCTFDDNLCIWKCLAIYKRFARCEKNRVQERNCEVAKNLAREYYGDKDLKKGTWGLQTCWFWRHCKK